MCNKKGADPDIIITMGLTVEGADPWRAGKGPQATGKGPQASGFWLTSDMHAGVDKADCGQFRAMLRSRPGVVTAPAGNLR